MYLFPSHHHPARPANRGFALILTLLILCLLIIVVVSYLSSMSIEQQTADAFASKSRAAQATQAAVDNATAMLAESFRDFPDSATVWDTQQSTNSGTPSNPSTVGGTSNEGTSLYLRAVPTTGSPVTADPNYSTTPTNSNYPSGNNPSNPACKTFVLPLVSGVPNGKAQLVGNKASILPVMDLTLKEPQTDPTKNDWVDLNIRRFGPNTNYPSGDNQGVIGSPPGWTGVGPKPARAFWVNLKGSNNLITSRYAFWIEDESFRANNSLCNDPSNDITHPVDNVARPLDASGKPRLEAPSDLTLFGPLTAAAISDPNGTTNNIIATRTQFYPNKFFPDSLAFSHALDGTTAQGIKAIDAVRYLTTNQSSALNISRHGSQRLNLNATISTTTDAPTIQTQVNQIVQTMEYHLPYLGERLYRTKAGALNDATQVPGSPYLTISGSSTDGMHTPVASTSHSQIYYYKIAANLRDYVDTDSQPTMIGTGGVVMSGAPTTDLGNTADSPPDPPQANQIWAQGKECTPYIQEVAVRYRPVVTTVGNASVSNPKGHYKLNVDYYIEFWNMSDRDITASQMNGPTVWIRDQQPWTAYTNNPTYLLEYDGVTPMGETLTNNHTPKDTQLDLTGSTATPVTDTTGVKYPNGVVFRAGAVTVVTSDPDAAGYLYQELKSSGSAGGKINYPLPSLPNGPGNVFICPVISGSRLYSGKITNTDGASVTTNGGLELGGSFLHSSPYTGTEVSLVNNQGYFDVVRGAITKTGSSGYYIYTNTDTVQGKQGNYNDFSYGSSLIGNIADSAGGPLPDPATGGAVSQLGDPRTNNEQIMVNVANMTSDGTRFMAATRTLGAPNYPEVQPDTTANGAGWPDYYKFPAGTNHPSPDATSAPSVIAGATAADGPLTSIGQLGDVFDPARLSNPSVSPPATSVVYSHGGGRTLKIGQHDDLYSDDPTNNVPTTNQGALINTIDNVPLSNGWASWRLTDIFDVDNPIQLPGRININGAMRDNGAALLAALQGFAFQPTTTSGTSDPVVHGDPSATLPGTKLDTAGTSNGFSQLMAQMKPRLTGSRVKPFFERGELGELGYSANGGTTPLFGINSTSTNNALVAAVDMNKTADHSREEMFRRLAQMICTRGNTFTVYAVGQSVLQTSTVGPLKITGTQRMRVTFRLVPKARDSAGNFSDFHPAYTTNADGTIKLPINSIDDTNPTEQLTSAGQIGVISRFAKPDRYDAQILEAIPY